MCIGVEGFRWWAQSPTNFDNDLALAIAQRIILAENGTTNRPPASAANKGFIHMSNLEPGGQITRSDGSTWTAFTEALPM